jgi:hypothetical protein
MGLVIFPMLKVEAAEPQETMESPPPLLPGYRTRHSDDFSLKSGVSFF